MRIPTSVFVLAVAAAFVADGRAQVTYTNSNTGANILLDTPSYTAIETFSGFSSISSMSWSLSSTSISNAVPATFNAYVAQWNTTTNSVVGNLTQFGATGALSINGTANVTFTDSWTAQNPSLTYALVLANVTGGGAYSANLGVNPTDDFFGTGGAGQAATSAALETFQSDLQTNGAATIDPSLSYTMSVTGIAATPVPEPKTAAAEIAALFVAALVGRQIWSRRKSAGTPQAA